MEKTQEGTIIKWIKKQRDLLEIEKEDEETQFRDLLKESRVKDLVAFGLCLHKLKVSNSKVGAFDKTVVAFCPQGFETQGQIEKCTDMNLIDRVKFTNNQKFSRGDMVSVYSHDKGSESFSGKPLAIGSVEKLDDFKITVCFSESDDDRIDFFGRDIDKFTFCLVQTVNDVTYRRFNECLERLEYYVRNPTAPHQNLIEVLFELRLPFENKTGETPAKIDEFFDTSLNEHQQLAVKRSVGCDFFHLIHGPPGTGKTKTVCEVVQQLCKKKKKILVTASSNIAVDNIIERLEQMKTSFRMIRIGNPTRTLE